MPKRPAYSAEIPRLAINQHTTELLPFDEDLRLYGAAGVRSVGIVREKLEAYGTNAGIDLLRRAGFRVCEFHVLELLHSPSKVDQLAYGRATIELAHRLACENICVIAGPWSGGNRREELARCVQTLKALAPYAEDAGVNLGLEPLGPFFCAIDVVTTVRRALAVAAEINSTRVGVALDIHHIWWDPDVLEWIRQARGRITAVQLNDVRVELEGKWDQEGNRIDMQQYTIPGEGMAPLAELLRSVERDGGYCGDYQVEIWDRRIWSLDGGAVVDRIVQGYRNLTAVPAVGGHRAG
jgi:sugar phosphate isomerase/epimerase